MWTSDQYAGGNSYCARGSTTETMYGSTAVRLHPPLTATHAGMDCNKRFLQETNTYGNSNLPSPALSTHYNRSPANSLMPGFIRCTTRRVAEASPGVLSSLHASPRVKLTGCHPQMCPHSPRGYVPKLPSSAGSLETADNTGLSSFKNHEIESRTVESSDSVAKGSTSPLHTPRNFEQTGLESNLAMDSLRSARGTYLADDCPLLDPSETVLNINNYGLEDTYISHRDDEFISLDSSKMKGLTENCREKREASKSCKKHLIETMNWEDGSLYCSCSRPVDLL